MCVRMYMSKLIGIEVDIVFVFFFVLGFYLVEDFEGILIVGNFRYCKRL